MEAVGRGRRPRAGAGRRGLWRRQQRLERRHHHLGRRRHDHGATAATTTAPPARPRRPATTATTGGSGGASGKTSITIGETLAPASLDITQQSGAAVPQALLYNVYETLVSIDDSGAYQPLLAADYKVSTDGLTYTFTLKRRPRVRRRHRRSRPTR